MIFNDKSRFIFILVAFGIASAAPYIFFSNNFEFDSVVGMAFALMILWMGRVRKYEVLMLALAILAAVYFSLSGSRILPWYSIVVLVTLTPHFRVRVMEMTNNAGFKAKDDLLGEKYDALEDFYHKEQRKVVRLENEVSRLARLYEISKEMEKVVNIDELTSKRWNH